MFQLKHCLEQPISSQFKCEEKQKTFWISFYFVFKRSVCGAIFLPGQGFGEAFKQQCELTQWMFGQALLLKQDKSSTNLPPSATTEINISRSVLSSSKELVQAVGA